MSLPDASITARCTLVSASDDRIVLAVPGTDYELHLVPGGPVSSPVGKRITGRIDATSLRIHPARGGGQFIEPVVGAPRIVAGTVIAIDDARRAVLVDAAVPIWTSWPDGQDTSFLLPGQLVNFYVQSGASFTPETRGG